MPLLEAWEVEAEITIRVRKRYSATSPAPLALSFTTTGESQGDNAKGLTEAMAPALDQALNEGRRIADNFRRESKDR